MPRNVRSMSGSFAARLTALALAGLAPGLSGCGGGGSRHSPPAAPAPPGAPAGHGGPMPPAVPAAPGAPATSPPFDPALDVVPFDPAKVRNWPGLPNFGTSCFINAVVKALAAVAELDPLLGDRAGDLPETARVRRQLRLTLNYIRSGAAPEAANGQDAHARMQALLAALAGHPALAFFAQSARHAGGVELNFLARLMRVLGAPEAFNLRAFSKTLPPGGPGPVHYHGLPITAGLTLSMDPVHAGYDPAAIDSVATVGDYWAWRCTQAAHWPGGGAEYLLPTQVPDVMLLSIVHFPPHKALKFSERLTFPVYAVDLAGHTDTVAGTVSRRAAAAMLGTASHVWAVVRGDDGWYLNDDQVPSHRIPDHDLDERITPHGTLVQGLSAIFYGPM